jgi:hypothetical protein
MLGFRVAADESSGYGTCRHYRAEAELKNGGTREVDS